MRALILVGGIGSRLRPLTTEVPKSLVPFVGRPMVEWQIEALAKIGVTEIVLAIGYKEEVMADFVFNIKKKYGVNVHCSVEKEPLNTGGPIKLAEKFLRNKSSTGGSKDDLFFVLNSDIICDYPFEELIKFHKSHDGLVSILVKEVEDPSRFGIVVHDAKSGLVSRFVEKPKDPVGFHINAGIYIFDEKILDLIELKNVSLEREIFPSVVEKGLFYCMRLNGFWKDIGLPGDFVACTKLYLQHFKEIGRNTVDEFRLVEDVDGFVGLNLVHPGFKSETKGIGPFCVIHNDVVIGKNCKISEAVLMDSCVIGDDCVIKQSILQNHVKIGNGTVVEKYSVIGTSAKLSAKSEITEKKIDSFVEI